MSTKKKNKGVAESAAVADAAGALSAVVSLQWEDGTWNNVQASTVEEVRGTPGGRICEIKIGPVRLLIRGNYSEVASKLAAVTGWPVRTVDLSAAEEPKTESNPPV